MRRFVPELGRTCSISNHTNNVSRLQERNTPHAKAAERIFKRAKSKKWLLINSLLFMASLFERDSLSTCYSTIATLISAICALNIFYYVVVLIKLHISSVEKTSCARHGVCLQCRFFENTANVTHYYRNSEKEFLNQNWGKFDRLLRAMDCVRLSRLWGNNFEIGLESVLRYVGQIARIWQTAELERLENKSRLDYNYYNISTDVSAFKKRGLDSMAELFKYWRNYLQKVEQSKIISDSSAHRISKEHGDSNAGVSNIIAIPRTLLNLRYQYSSDYYDQPSVRFDRYPSLSKNCKEVLALYPFWLRNMTFWFSSKIHGFLKEVEEANYALETVGLKTVRIGKSSPSCLWSAFSSHPTLHKYKELLPFISLTQNQSNLISRYRSLASGSLSSFTWNATVATRENSSIGNSSDVTDAEILFNFFCAYLDLKSANCKFQKCSNANCNCKMKLCLSYLVDGSPRSWPANTDKLSIIRRPTFSPHYDLCVNGLTVEISPGQNNLFLALAYFLHYVSVCDGGRFGTTSLDKDGLNLLWIVTDSHVDLDRTWK